MFEDKELRQKVDGIDKRVSGVEDAVYEWEPRTRGYRITRIANAIERVEHLEAKIERLLEALGYEEVVIPEQPKKIVMRKKGKK